MSEIDLGTLAFEPAEPFRDSVAARFGLKAARMPRLMAGLRWTAWMLCAAIAVALLWQPVGVAAQLWLGVAVIVAMALLRSVRGGRILRWTFLALGTFIILRYVYWRATQTLPDVDDVAGFTFGMLLALAELYCAFVLAVSLIINSDPLERSDAPCMPDPQLPDVDVFIPSYDESPEILAMTIAAARAMDYPQGKLKVFLLDDGGTDQKCADPDPAKAHASKSRRAALKMLCAQLGANYVTRPRNVHAKAGNLNNGLAHSAAPIVVVFDADLVPFRSFLRETIGYFASDPKLFLVQTPHVFLNRDPVERNLRTFERMPSENEMFYSVTQRGLDKWNGSFFCGSAAKYIQGMYLVKAIASVAIAPRKPTFNVTAKGLSLDRDHLSEMAWPFVATFVVLLIGVATAAWRYAFEPGVTGVMLVVGLWALFNLVIAAAALGVVTERRELRRHPRLAVERRGSISFDGVTARVAIENVSAGGCAVRVAASQSVERALQSSRCQVQLTIEGVAGERQRLEVSHARVERDGDALVIGLKFDVVTAVDYFVLADLMYGDADALTAFLKKRRKHMGILRGTFVFLRWSVCEPFRAFHHLFADARRSAAGRAPSTTAFAAPAKTRMVRSPPIAPELPGADAGPSGSLVDPSLQSFGGADALLVPRS
jgi:hypothetical protein